MLDLGEINGEIVEVKKFMFVDDISIDIDLSLPKEELQKVIELNPQYVRGYLDLAIIYLGLKKATKALPLLKKSIEIDPGSAEAYSSLAMAYSSLEEFNESMGYLRKCLPRMVNRRFTPRCRMVLSLIRTPLS